MPAASYHTTSKLGGRRTAALPKQVPATSTRLPGVETPKYQASACGTGFLACPFSPEVPLPHISEAHLHPPLLPALYLAKDEKITFTSPTVRTFPTHPGSFLTPTSRLMLCFWDITLACVETRADGRLHDGSAPAWAQD